MMPRGIALFRAGVFRGWPVPVLAVAIWRQLFLTPVS